LQEKRYVAEEKKGFFGEHFSNNFNRQYFIIAQAITIKSTEINILIKSENNFNGSITTFLLIIIARLTAITQARAYREPTSKERLSDEKNIYFFSVKSSAQLNRRQ
jgi:hypothetical protein